MKKSKKNYVVIALVVILLGLAIGYAAFTDTLNITGTATANGTFDMEFTSASLVNSVGIVAENSSATVSTDKNTVNVAVELTYPGSGTDVTVVIHNASSVPAVLKTLDFNGLDDDDDVKVTMPDDWAAGEEIAADGTCTVTFSVEWLPTSEFTGEKDVSFSATAVYEQKVDGTFTGAPSHT